VIVISVDWLALYRDQTKTPAVMIMASSEIVSGVQYLLAIAVLLIRLYIAIWAAIGGKDNLPVQFAIRLVKATV